MAAAMKIQIEFSDIDKSDPFLENIVKYIEVFLNMDLTQLSLNVWWNCGSN